MADRSFPDQNLTKSLIAVSNADGVTPVSLWADPVTHLLQVSGGGGSGGTQYQELATTSPATGTLALGRYQTSLPTLTNGQMNEPMLDATSTLLVNSSTLATAANQSTMATNQTSGNQLTKITDGTNAANVLSSTTANSTGNALLVGNTSKSVTFSVTTGNNAGPYDVGNYSWVSITVVTNMAGSNNNVQWSNDGTNFTNGLVSLVSTTSVGGSTVNSAGTYSGPALGRYFQIACSGGTGTFTGTIVFSTLPRVNNNLNYVLTVNGSGGNQPVNTPQAIGLTSASLNGEIATANYLYNGTNFDIQRNNTSVVVVAAGSTSTTTQTVTTYNARSLVLAVNITAGAGTLTVAISGSTTSGYTYPILTSTALAGVADNTLRVFPGATPASNTVANDALPRTLSITYTVVGSVTFGSDAVLSV